MMIMSTSDYVMLDGAPIFKPYVRYVVPNEMGQMWRQQEAIGWKFSAIESFERRYGGQDLNGKRLCISRMHGMGDQLIVSALPRYLKHLYPAAEIAVYSAESYASPLWAGNPHIAGGRIIPLPLELDAMRQYDYHLLFDGMIESNREWDQANAYDDMFAYAGLRNVPDGFKRPDLHEAKGDGELVESLAWSRDEPYIVFAIATSSPIRNWPWEKSERFIDMFVQAHPDMRIAVIGSAATMGEEVRQFQHERVEWLVDKVPRVRQHFPLIAGAQAFAGPDTGFLHIAGAYGTPVVGLYGPFSSNSRAKYYKGVGIEKPGVCKYAPCWQHGMEIPRDRCKWAKGYNEEMINCVCLAAIEPEEVLAAVEGCMDEGNMRAMPAPSAKGRVKVNVYIPVNGRWEKARKSIAQFGRSIAGEKDDFNVMVCADSEDCPRDFPFWREQPWERGIGIQAQRANHILHADESDCDYAYFTDADAIHLEDGWYGRLKELSERTGLIASGYRTGAHDGDRVEEYEDWVEHKYPTGISMLIPRDKLRVLARYVRKHGLDAFKELPGHGFDWGIPLVLQETVAVSKESVVQHDGAGGMHANPENQDRALCPHDGLRGYL